MLDPRIYRTSLIVVAVAVIVVAFSLGSQKGAMSTTLVPDAFSGPTAYTTMGALAAGFPDRRPGSVGDQGVANAVARAFAADGLAVRRTETTAQTLEGPRTVETVTGALAGATPGTIVVVAHRDAPHPGSVADLSGTAVLLELAKMLSSQTQEHPIVVASTSASTGAAGAAELARRLPGPVDAVLVLGDMAGAEVRAPIVVPWSDSTLVASPQLRNTVAAALQQQAGVNPGDDALGGQFLHLAFPLVATEQRPFATAGDSAVLVSTSGSRLPAHDEPASQAQITRFGRAMLETVTALESGPSVPGPSSYLGWQGKLIPAWAIRLLVLALIVPVLVATIDGLARARRRGYRVARWTLWVLSACIPFALAVIVIALLRVVGLIHGAPPGPVDGAALSVDGRAVGILAGLGGLIVLSALGVWWLGRRAWGAKPVQPADAATHARANGRGNGNGNHRRRPAVQDDAASPGAAAALLLVLCLVTLLIWVSNPFAAALTVPALHLWMWIVGPERRPRAPWTVLLFAAGLAPGVFAGLYYAAVLGLRPAPAAWNAVLMLAGGGYGVLAALEWSVVLGCTVSLALMMVRIARQPRPAPIPVTVRGPSPTPVRAPSGGRARRCGAEDGDPRAPGVILGRLRRRPWGRAGPSGPGQKACSYPVNGPSASTNTRPAGPSTTDPIQVSSVSFNRFTLGAGMHAHSS